MITILSLEETLNKDTVKNKQGCFSNAIRPTECTVEYGRDAWSRDHKYKTAAEIS